MLRLALILILSSLGGTFAVHYLKNFLLKEKIKLRLDWDGIVERLCVTYIILAAPAFWFLIPLIVIIKSLFRLSLLGFAAGIFQSSEPGAASQKVLIKSEIACDLLLSPAFAILVGAVFK